MSQLFAGDEFWITRGLEQSQVYVLGKGQDVSTIFVDMLLSKSSLATTILVAIGLKAIGNYM